MVAEIVYFERPRITNCFSLPCSLSLERARSPTVRCLFFHPFLCHQMEKPSSLLALSVYRARKEAIVLLSITDFSHLALAYLNCEWYLANMLLFVLHFWNVMQYWNGIVFAPHDHHPDVRSICATDIAPTHDRDMIMKFTDGIIQWQAAAAVATTPASNNEIHNYFTCIAIARAQAPP